MVGVESGLSGLEWGLAEECMKGFSTASQTTQALMGWVAQLMGLSPWEPHSTALHTPSPLGRFTMRSQERQG